jgi:hypothetical protein
MMLACLLLAGLAACSGGDQDGEQAQSEVKAELIPEAGVRAAEVQNVEKCRAASKKLGGALKSALQDAVAEGGPLNAVDVCHADAEIIAKEISATEGLTVGRTSRKFRNPANAPDEWERAGLEAFAERMAGGGNPGDLEMWATVTGADGARTFRYLKAIPTGPLCLKCHGGELDQDLDQKLVELYPDDHARGFAVGDMRGAFTVKLLLPKAESAGG